jgi:membrane protease subunit HflK
MSDIPQSPNDISLPVQPAPEGSRFGKAHHILLAFLGLAALIWLLSGIYQVNNDQVAIIERLGTYVMDNDGHAHQVERGLHYALPWPIDRILKISTKQQRTLTVAWFNESPDAYAGVKSEFMRQGLPQALLDAIFDPYLITGDLNVIHMKLAVQYRVDDPEAWLTTVAHSDEDSDDLTGKREDLFQEIAKHAMTSQVASMPVDTVLFAQTGLPTTLSAAIDKAMTLPDPLDPTGKLKTHMGVHVQSVDLLAVRPPDLVRDSFDAVGRAIQQADQSRTQAKAQAYADMQDALAKTSTLQSDANAYSNQVIGAAKNEATRFSQVFAQYQKAPDVTMWNVYVDAVKSVTASATRIIFAQPGQRTTIILDPPQFDETQVGPPGRGP